MHRVTVSMVVSLAGHVVGPEGRFDRTGPDAEVCRYATDELRATAVRLATGGLAQVVARRRATTRSSACRVVGLRQHVVR